jgi:uncharacterized protein Yka (UPF0111/DUF47 family)
MNWRSSLRQFASRTRPPDAFVEQFKNIVALAVSATDQLALALEGQPERALHSICQIEHDADEAVRQVYRLVDETFIPPLRQT